MKVWTKVVLMTDNNAPEIQAVEYENVQVPGSTTGSSIEVGKGNEHIICKNRSTQLLFKLKSKQTNETETHKF